MSGSTTVTCFASLVAGSETGSLYADARVRSPPSVSASATTPTCCSVASPAPLDLVVDSPVSPLSSPLPYMFARAPCAIFPPWPSSLELALTTPRPSSGPVLRHALVAPVARFARPWTRPLAPALSRAAPTLPGLPPAAASALFHPQSLPPHARSPWSRLLPHPSPSPAAELAASVQPLELLLPRPGCAPPVPSRLSLAYCLPCRRALLLAAA